jgi:AraC-like DNA-binding protein
MDDLEPLVRGGAIGAVLPMLAAFWRARPGSGFAWTGSFWLVGYIGYLLAGSSSFSNWPPLVQLLLVILSLSPPFFLWAFARIVFEDEFRLRPWHFVWLAFVEGPGLALALAWDGGDARLKTLLGLGFRLSAMGLFGHAFWLVWRGRRTDLVDARARLRVGMVAGTGSVGLAILLAGILFGPVELRPPSVKLGEAFAYLLAGSVLTMALTRLDPAVLPLASQEQPDLKQGAPEDAAGPMQPDLPGDEAEAFAKLSSLMSKGEVWRESGLGVGDLAKRVGIPEYRLRRLINQRLGYRNFTAFLNGYRLAAAARMLEDPAERRTPILTIALDLGWGSIGPFNRAFRARFDLTPSDYRRAVMSAVSPPEDELPIFENSGRFRKRRDMEQMRRD